MLAGVSAEGFDRGAAVTRSMLGYGVLAGPFFLVFGLTLALTRDGFDLSEHALSLLTLGENGWLQSLNFVLSGAMMLVAAAGFHRALRDSGRPAIARLIGVYGASLIAAAIFEPDAADDFPVAGASSEATLSGVLHLAAGAIGFLSLAAAALLLARWLDDRGQDRAAGRSRLAAATVVLGFLAGAALSAGPAGVLLLWVAVLATWGWLAWASVCVYRTVPHPDAHRRSGAEGV